jgi:hypothetical protein
VTWSEANRLPARGFVCEFALFSIQQKSCFGLVKIDHICIEWQIRHSGDSQ